MINHCENSQKNEEAQKKRLDYAKTRCTNLLLDIWSSLDAINGGHPYRRWEEGSTTFSQPFTSNFLSSPNNN
jgi:hypothetical protein